MCTHAHAQMHAHTRMHANAQAHTCTYIQQQQQYILASLILLASSGVLKLSVGKYCPPQWATDLGILPEPILVIGEGR